MSTPATTATRSAFHRLLRHHHHRISSSLSTLTKQSTHLIPPASPSPPTFSSTSYISLRNLLSSYSTSQSHHKTPICRPNNHPWIRLPHSSTKYNPAKQTTSFASLYSTFTNNPIPPSNPNPNPTSIITWIITLIAVAAAGFGGAWMAVHRGLGEGWIVEARRKQDVKGKGGNDQSQSGRKESVDQGVREGGNNGVVAIGGDVGVVHKARLKLLNNSSTLATSQDVAVKVLHPGVDTQIIIDLAILKAGATFLHYVIPDARWISLPDEVSVFAEMMQAQVDLRVEANNLREFRDGFEGWKVGSGLPVPQLDEALKGHGTYVHGNGRGCGVEFPKPVEGFVSKRVLVEEFLDGVPLARFLAVRDFGRGKGGGAGGEGTPFDKALARIGIQAFLKMLLVDNMVHADLHPGNIMVSFRDGDTGRVILPNEHVSWAAVGTETKFDDVAFQKSLMDMVKRYPNVMPRLVLLDAGLVSRLSDCNLDNLRDLLWAVLRFDGFTVARLMVERSKDPSSVVDFKGFQVRMQNLLNNVQRSALRLSEVTVSGILMEVFDMVRVHRVRLEGEFANVGIALVLAEGVGRRLDPAVDLLDEARPVLRGVMLGEIGGAVGGKSKGIGRKVFGVDARDWWLAQVGLDVYGGVRDLYKVFIGKFSGGTSGG
ncbi:hypothetical protein HDU76_000915 [Blyttiomyces sp. JEL0837]|nr:hypothetical protein HDU76_000915 [Blyttiomyces sp. JEL0837]